MSLLGDIVDGIETIAAVQRRLEAQRRRRPVYGPPAPEVAGPPVPGVSSPIPRATPYRRPTRRARPKPKPVARARREGSGGQAFLVAQPLAVLRTEKRAADRRVAEALARLPNAPRLARVPIRPQYTARERDAILRVQGPRIGALMKATGLSASELERALPEEDRLQVRLFAGLAKQRGQKVAKGLERTRRATVRRLLESGMSRRDVAHALAPARAVPGRPRGALGTAVRAAGVDLPMALVGHDFSVPLAQIGQVGSAVNELSGVGDVIKGTALSTWELGEAGVAAAQGDLGPAKRFARNTVQGLASGVAGHLVRGDPKGALAYFADQPLMAALELSGGRAVVGRGAGTVMRSGAVGQRAKRAAAMRRAPLRDTYGRTLATRQYPPDVLEKAAIVARERSQRRRGVDPNVSRRSHVPTRGHLGASAGAVDEFTAMAEGVRRLGRDDAARRMVGVIPDRGGRRVSRVVDRHLPARLRPERDVVMAVAERRVDPRHFERDLRAEVARLDRVYELRDHPDPAKRVTMTRAQARANREQVTTFKRVLASPRALANARGVAAAAERYRVAAERVEGELVRRRALEPEQAMASKLRPYAVARMGARYDHRKSAPEHMATRYEQARAIERAAGARVAAAREAERRAASEVAASGRAVTSRRGRAGVAQGRAEILSGQVARRADVEGARARLRAAQQDSVRARSATRGARSLEEQLAAQGAVQRATRRIETAREALAREVAKAEGRLPARTLGRLERERAGVLVGEHRARAAAAGVRDARASRRAAESELRAARKQREGADPRRYTTGLVDERGRRLSNEDILRHLEENGLDLPAFVSHRMDTRGARSFMHNWFGRRSTVEGPRVRTGRATELGAHGSDLTAMLEQHVRQQGVADAIGTVDSFARHFGIKQSDGRLFTWDEAQRLVDDPTPLGAFDADDNPVAGFEELVPVRVIPARYSEAAREAIAEMQDSTRLPDLERLMGTRLREAMTEPEGRARRARNVVLVPRSEVERFAEHQTKGTGATSRAGQVWSNVFRRTVLPFSAKWFFGNVAEAALRLAINGVTPWDVRIGMRVVRGMERADARLAREFRSRTLGGLLYGSEGRLSVHRTAESFRDSPALSTVAGVAGVLRRTPVLKQALDGVRVYQDAAFNLNRRIEQLGQLGVIGKQARQQMYEMTGSWTKALRASESAFDDLLRGLVETPNQVRFARAIDDVLGKYNRFSPGMRRLIQSGMPFLPWYLNAYRFVLWTLPVDHPIKTGLMAHVAMAFQEDFEAQHRDLPPGDLQWGLVMDDGGVLPLARYTPFGAFAELPEGLPEPLLPQISSVIKNLQGRSFTGHELRTAEGEVPRGERWGIAAYAFLESVLPGLSIARRVREGGSTPYDDSTLWAPSVKPNTKRGGAADRILNPLRRIYLSGAGPISGAGGGVPSVGETVDWSNAVPAGGEALDWSNAVVVSP